MKLDGARVLVTGSAKRVGKSIALALGARGAHIALHYHTSHDQAAATAAEIKQISGRDPVLLQGDITKRAVWEDMARQVTETMGGVNVLVHNASTFVRTPFLETSEADWDYIMNTNLKSALFGSQVFGEMMMQSNGGKIIAISDVAGALVWPGYIPYCVSKAGLSAMMRGLARSFAPHVQVNVVSPGPVLLPEDTSEGEEERILNTLPMQRLGSPEDVAHAVRYLIEDGDFITGHELRVDGGRSIGYV